MNRHSVGWRARWALAQITGLVFSSAVWVVLVASAPEIVVAALLGGAAFVVGLGTRPVFWLAFGARPAAAAGRDAVLRAIVPVASLRGRNQPRVFVAKGRRDVGWGVLAPCPHTLLVSESMLARIEAREITELEVSARVSYAFGQAQALGSRVRLAVGVYCLPWTITQIVVAMVATQLSMVPLMSFASRTRPVVFILGLLDAVQHGRWEAAIPLVVLAVLTYTTRPFEQAWKRTLVELGDRRVTAEGLGPVFAIKVLDRRDSAGRRRGDLLLRERT